MGDRSDASAMRFASEIAVHLDAVFRYFRRRAVSTDVDDLTAEVFEIAWRKLADIPSERALPWLYRTAGFVLANHRRRVQGLPLQLVDEPTDEDHAHRIAERDQLSRALAALSERDREVLLLHAWEGLSGDELGEALAISRSGAQAALSRARTRFREVWELDAQDLPAY